MMITTWILLICNQCVIKYSLIFRNNLSVSPIKVQTERIRMMMIKIPHWIWKIPFILFQKRVMVQIARNKLKFFHDHWLLFALNSREEIWWKPEENSSMNSIMKAYLELIEILFISSVVGFCFLLPLSYLHHWDISLCSVKIVWFHLHSPHIYFLQ